MTVVRDSWPYVLLFALAMSGAAFWGFRFEPEPIAPLLGRRPYEPPSPSPTLPPPRTVPMPSR